MDNESFDAMGFQICRNGPNTLPSRLFRDTESIRIVPNEKEVELNFELNGKTYYKLNCTPRQLPSKIEYYKGLGFKEG